MSTTDNTSNDKEAFDSHKMPAGSRERFLAKLHETSAVKTKHKKIIRMSLLSTAIAATLALVLILQGLGYAVQDPVKTTRDNNDKLVMMRQFYDKKVDIAISSLEDVMENVDDTTKMQLNEVIRNLLDIGDVFAEISPLPEDRQLAIAELILGNNLRTIELIQKKINK